MVSAAGVSGTGWIELRPCWVRSMGRYAWQAAEAEFEGVWGSNSSSESPDQPRANRL